MLGREGQEGRPDRPEAQAQKRRGTLAGRAGPARQLEQEGGTLMAAFIVTSKVKRVIRDSGKRVSTGFLFALDAHVNRLILAAAQEKDGGRKTVDAELLVALLAKGVR